MVKPQPPRKTTHIKALNPERAHLAIQFPRVAGYRVELPEERLLADFNEDSILKLTPEIVGASQVQNSGIVGEVADLSLQHLDDMRRSTLLMHLTKRLLYTKWRDPGEEPKLHLFGQLKRITKQWLDNHLKCVGGTFPAQLMYQELADMACERITAGITRAFAGEKPVRVMLDAYNPTGSTQHVSFHTSKAELWATSAAHCHVNFAVLDSDWEAEFCRVAESHPKVKAYVKNHNLGLEVPYKLGSSQHTYIPDFIVLVDDGQADLLHLIVEIKGYRREDAIVKAETMNTYWIPGVNNLKQYGRWAFAEFGDVWEMQDKFAEKIKEQFENMISKTVSAEQQKDKAHG